MDLNENSSMPLYGQVKNIILSEIQTGHWKAGEQLKPELELSEQYGVSRVTVSDKTSGKRNFCKPAEAAEEN